MQPNALHHLSVLVKTPLKKYGNQARVPPSAWWLPSTKRSVRRLGLSLRGTKTTVFPIGAAFAPPYRDEPAFASPAPSGVAVNWGSPLILTVLRPVATLYPADHHGNPAHCNCTSAGWSCV